MTNILVHYTRWSACLALRHRGLGQSSKVAVAVAGRPGGCVRACQPALMLPAEEPVGWYDKVESPRESPSSSGMLLVNHLAEATEVNVSDTCNRGGRSGPILPQGCPQQVRRCRGGMGSRVKGQPPSLLEWRHTSNRAITPAKHNSTLPLHVHMVHTVSDQPAAARGQRCQNKRLAWLIMA